jgi:hypothetical protein
LPAINGVRLLIPHALPAQRSRGAHGLR